MTPEQVWRGLQSCQLPPDHFTHERHLMAAWHITGQLPMPQAAAAFVTALNNYTKHVGATDKYHETITLTYLYEVATRRQLQDPWDAFIAANGELLNHGAFMAKRYRQEDLHSTFARQHYLPPMLSDQESGSISSAMR